MDCTDPDHDSCADRRSFVPVGISEGEEYLNRYSSVRSMTGMTGAEAAQRIVKFPGNL